MKSMMWILLSLGLGTAAVAASIWGWRANQTAEGLGRAMANVSARANAEKAELERRVAESEAKAKTLQSIIDQTANHQTAQAQADQAAREAQIQAMQAEVEAARRRAVAPTPMTYTAPPVSGREVAETVPVRIFSEAVTVLEASGDYVKWSWKAKLHNPSSAPQTGMLHCELLDSRGFRVDEGIEFLTVPSGRTVDLSGEGMTKGAVWDRYKKHRFFFK